MLYSNRRFTWKMYTLIIAINYIISTICEEMVQLIDQQNFNEIIPQIKKSQFFFQSQDSLNYWFSFSPFVIFHFVNVQLEKSTTAG